MAEESDLEKTEAASPRRLEKAREEGQVPRSRELSTFLVLATGVGVLWGGGAYIYESLDGIMRHALGFDPNLSRDMNVALSSAAESGWRALLTVLPILGLLAVAGIFSGLALGGLVWSGKPLEFNFSKLDPLAGFGRMFSWQTVVELTKAVSKALVVGSVAVAAIWSYHDEMIGLMHAAPAAALASTLNIIGMCCAFAVGALLLIALMDVPWQIFSHAKKLRMSKQDVKQEFKESEGDPMIKARIRQMQRQAARQRMMAAVPQADVVVTNPTRYAVALRYSDGDMAAPKVVAKGMGEIAARIRELAQEHRVPMLEAPPLARALYRHVDLGQEIPAALYTAVAEVLAWVFQLRSWRPGWTPPVPPTNLPVPAGMDPQAGAAAAMAAEGA
ncbi:flagellar biosynthesis protein FlhB [Bordetella genomosp. 11]|uniref:Flagellar biosynthetic protein FlhB n=1 Tax=Bordetella genomosp. 11 TaxID=1416808 RepID=A0A261UEC7_9BORD|nr:flagellar biosynthesis protein FlhB [Bordetella genomosp. 11]OZI60298.1 flagellar biosynthesis protein FlhB [Bordetella genomosp. 11]